MCYMHATYTTGCDVCEHHPPPAFYDAVRKSMRNATVPGLADDDGYGYPLIDALTDDGGTVDQGIDRVSEIADDAAFDLWHAIKTDAELRGVLSTVFTTNK